MLSITSNLFIVLIIKQLVEIFQLYSRYHFVFLCGKTLCYYTIYSTRKASQSDKSSNAVPTCVTNLNSIVNTMLSEQKRITLPLDTTTLLFDSGTFVFHIEGYNGTINIHLKLVRYFPEQASEFSTYSSLLFLPLKHGRKL